MTSSRAELDGRARRYSCKPACSERHVSRLVLRRQSPVAFSIRSSFNSHCAARKYTCTVTMQAHAHISHGHGRPRNKVRAFTEHTAPYLPPMRHADFVQSCSRAPHRIASWQQIPRANPRARLHAQSFHPERMCLEYCSSLSCGLSHATAREAPTAFAAPPCPAKHSLVAFALPAPRRHLIRPCARTYPQRIISTMPSSSAALRSAWTSSRIQRLAFHG